MCTHTWLFASGKKFHRYLLPSFFFSSSFFLSSLIFFNRLRSFRFFFGRFMFYIIINRLVVFFFFVLLVTRFFRFQHSLADFPQLFHAVPRFCFPRCFRFFLNVSIYFFTNHGKKTIGRVCDRFVHITFSHFADGGTIHCHTEIGRYTTVAERQLLWFEKRRMKERRKDERVKE